MMVNLDEYYQVWKCRLSSLNKSYEQIKLLSVPAQFMQAIIVRNACLDFVTELDLAFEAIASDAIKRQDELFLAAVDDIRLSEFSKKPWPLNVDSSVQLQRKCLREDVTKWAIQAIEFEASILYIQAVYKNQAYSIIGRLTDTYGVSPRSNRKRR